MCAFYGAFAVEGDWEGQFVMVRAMEDLVPDVTSYVVE